jgi:hypothetical protein
MKYVFEFFISALGVLTITNPSNAVEAPGGSGRILSRLTNTTGLGYARS